MYPDPGDVTLCLLCGQFSTFDEHLNLNKLTPAQYAEVLAHPAVPPMIEAWVTAVLLSRHRQILKLQMRAKPDWWVRHSIACPKTERLL